MKEILNAKTTNSIGVSWEWGLRCPIGMGSSPPGQVTDYPIMVMNLAPIIPQRKPEPVADPQWACELKLDGFRGLADTINGRLLSKNLNPLKRYRRLLDSLPPGCVFDGEICVLD